MDDSSALIMGLAVIGAGSVCICVNDISLHGPLNYPDFVGTYSPRLRSRYNGIRVLNK